LSLPDIAIVDIARMTEMAQAIRNAEWQSHQLSPWEELSQSWRDRYLGMAKAALLAAANAAEKSRMSDLRAGLADVLRLNGDTCTRANADHLADVLLSLPDIAIVNAGKNVCPICRHTVTRTRLHHICGHYDKAGHVCPGSYEPFDLTIIDDQPKETT
jgi:hypothetical protein